MSIIKPFRAFRPAKDKVHLVASRPVDFYSRSQLQSKLAENSYSFLHVVKPEFGSDKKLKPGSPEQLSLIRKKFDSFCEKGYLIQDRSPSFYLYRQIQPEGSFTGIIAGAPVDEYLQGSIKKHEQTLTKKEETLKNYLSVCNFNAEPVSLTYPADPVIDQITSHYTENHQPVYDFTTTDHNRHQVWIVNAPYDVVTLQQRFRNIPSIYIADGHHRSASSARLAVEKRASGKYSGKEGFNYFMGIYFPDHQLKIYDYNRVIRDLGDYTKDSFLNKLEPFFKISKKGTSIYKPGTLHNFSLYLDGEWFSLETRKSVYEGKGASAGLDAAILSDEILAPLLGIKDLRNDNRVSFVAGTKGMEGIQNMVEKKKMKAGFGLFPVSFEQLREVADANETMPPKSTWIEPKLRNGLIVYCLGDEMV